jgi:hypothetical protein
VLYVRDAPIPEDVDGKVLTSALAFDRGAKQGESAKADPTEDTQYSADEEAEIHERLQALGYVE